MVKRKISYKGIILLCLSALSWGFSGSCIQFLSQTQNINSFYIASMRVVLSGIILLAVGLCFRRKQLLTYIKDRSMWIPTVIYALFCVIACQLTYLMTISYTNASIATMLEQYGLIIVLIYTCLKRKSFPRLIEVAAIFCALIAGILLTTHLDFSGLAISTPGLIWGILSAFTVSMYLIYPARLLARYEGFEVTTVSMVVAGIISLTVFRPWQYEVAITPDWFLGMFGIVIMGTVVAYVLFLKGMKLAGPLVSGLINSSELGWATIISALWLGTNLTSYDIVALFLVILLVILTTIGDAQEQRVTKPLSKKRTSLKARSRDE